MGISIISPNSEQLLGLLAALGGGLLVGVERERQKGEGDMRAPAGVRTFTLIALAGAVAALISTPAMLLGVATVGLFAYAGYVRTQIADPGLTTELAMLLVYFLGVLAMQDARLAAGLAVLVTILLASKQVLHQFTRNTLSEQELREGLILAASALIVLPLLPDVPIDSWSVFNPRRVWLFAVLVMTINATGYVALRTFGSGRGLPLAGFIGGFVSSIATIAGMGQRARADPHLRSACVAAGLLSNVSTLIQLTLILLAVSPSLLRHMMMPLIVAGITAIAIASLFAWRGQGDIGHDGALPNGRPFELKQALLFSAIVTIALLLSALLQHWIGLNGVLMAAAATGLADVHAAAVSLGQLEMSNSVNTHATANALVAAFTTNSLVKCMVAMSSGGRNYAYPLVIGIILINVAIAVTVWFM